MLAVAKRIWGSILLNPGNDFADCLVIDCVSLPFEYF